MSMKNPLTPAGIEPATFRFVAQHLNHCATAVPTNKCVDILNFIRISRRVPENLEVLSPQGCKATSSDANQHQNCIPDTNPYSFIRGCNRVGLRPHIRWVRLLFLR